MPTSETGTLKSDRADLTGPPSSRCDSGFTLLELLVVLVIIGIVSTMAVLSTRVLGGDHQMDREAQRLQAVLIQAREESMLDGRDVGLRVDRSGYDFLRYNNRVSAWEPVVDDTLFRERQLPDGLNAGLRLEARDVVLKPRSAPTDDAPALPQVVVQASGDLAPFELLLSRDGTQETRRIEGTIDGKIEVHDDTEPRR